MCSNWECRTPNSGVVAPWKGGKVVGICEGHAKKFKGKALFFFLNWVVGTEMLIFIWVIFLLAIYKYSSALLLSISN